MNKIFRSFKKKNSNKKGEIFYKVAISFGQPKHKNKKKTYKKYPKRKYKKNNNKLLV